MQHLPFKLGTWKSSEIFLLMQTLLGTLLTLFMLNNLIHAPFIPITGNTFCLTAPELLPLASTEFCLNSNCIKSNDLFCTTALTNEITMLMSLSSTHAS